jgi:hypothetical protein
MITKQNLHDIIMKHVLVRKTPDLKTSLIANNSSWLLDFRGAFMDSTLLEQFATFFWDTYESHFPFQV